MGILWLDKSQDAFLIEMYVRCQMGTGDRMGRVSDTRRAGSDWGIIALESFTIRLHDGVG